MIAAAIYYIRQFAIFRFLWWILRNIWPFIVFLCFWPEIDSFMSQFYLWREMMWRLEDFWWLLSRNEYFIAVSDFIKDAFGWNPALREHRLSAAIRIFLGRPQLRPHYIR